MMVSLDEVGAKGCSAAWRCIRRGPLDIGVLDNYVLQLSGASQVIIKAANFVVFLIQHVQAK